MTEQQIRGRIEAMYKRHFRRPMLEPTWDKLKQDGWIGDIQKGEYDCEGVFEEVKRWAAALGIAPGLEPPQQRLIERSSSKERASTDVALRFEALSRLAADEASRYRHVKSLRQKHLNIELLSIDAVRAWLVAFARREKQSTPEPIDMVPHPQTRRAQVDFWRRQGFELLQFLEPIDIPDLGPHPTATAPKAIRLDRCRGTLEKIRLESAAIASEFSWEEAAATTFLLTSRVPQVCPVEAWYNPAMFTGLSRVTLSVHPSLTPQEIAKAWTDIRKKVLGERHRNQTDKHLTIAIFDSEQAQGATLKEKMTAWNKRYGKKPKWGYSEETNFGRDVQRTRRRLLGPEV
jgi:hypothetical protein